ncbi:MAG: glycosyltransferase family 4 protein [Candidatus Sungbacteria bacterium]|nr:glycosyltransferase family 4 protein [Candidatus Sungbacteria bacterium]
MARKKILFVITKSVWGGAGKYVYDLATNLPADAFDIAVAAGGNGPLFQKLADAGIRTIYIPELDRDIHIGKELRSFHALRNLFEREQPDVIHLNSSKVGGLGGLAGRITAWRARKKMRIVFTVHGWGFLEDRHLFWRAAAFLASWASTLFQDAVILINSRDYAVAEKFIPRRKLALIQNGLSQHAFAAQEDARRFLSEKTGREIPTDALFIGTIAELTKNKGLNYLIDAAKHMHCHSRPASKCGINSSGNPDQRESGFPIKSGMTIRENAINPKIKFRFLIIGEGEDRIRLEQQIRDLHLEDTVFLLGFIPDAAQHLPGMDMFVLPSVKEGLPYVVMEAMAAGTPVIASNVGGIPDLIAHNETGVLVLPKNPQALAEAIELLIQNPEQRVLLGKRASDSVRTKFSLRAMLEKTQQLYDTAD